MSDCWDRNASVANLLQAPPKSRRNFRPGGAVRQYALMLGRARGRDNGLGAALDGVVDVEGTIGKDIAAVVRHL